MRTIQLKFERGGSLTADLLDELAPETCKAFWNLLPMRQKLSHAKFPGHVISIFPGINLELMENSRCVGVLPGEILFNPHVTNRPPHPKEL
jgi:hypothetical protein